MTQRTALTPEQLAEALATLPAWSVQDGKLTRQFRFRNFARAMGWMMSAAIVIDKLNHHPEWSNVYNRVTVQLTTHDLGNQISSLDVELARKLDELADG